MAGHDNPLAWRDLGRARESPYGQRVSRLRDRLDRAFVRLAGRLPARLQISLAGRCDRIDGQQLHPELRLVNRLLALAGDIPFQELPVEQARTLLERQAWLFAGRPIPVGSVREVTLPGPAGPLQARLYTPDPSSETSPLLVYFHGGGMALGSLDRKSVV